MPRTLPTFVMAVLFPVLLGVAVSVLFLEQAQAGTQIRSDLRMSQAGSYLLRSELIAARDSLAPGAEESSMPTPATPAVRRALSGDTVMTVAAAADGLRITVLLSRDGEVLAAAGRIPDDFIDAFQSVTNYGLSVYLGANRVLTGRPPLGPPALPGHVVTALGRGDTSVAVSVPSGQAIVTRLGGAVGTEDELALIVGQTERRMPTTLLVPPLAALGMILLLSLAAAWSIKDGSSESAVGRQPRPVMQTVLVVLIPVLAGVALLASLDQGFRSSVEGAVQGDLARASALIRLMGEAGSVETAQSLGFDAALIEQGVVRASTITEGASRDQLAAIRPPPPTFSTTGRVRLGEIEHTYMASRPRGGGVMVLLARGPEADATEFRFRLLTAGLLMAIPSLLYLGLLVVSARGPVTGRE